MEWDTASRRRAYDDRYAYTYRRGKYEISRRGVGDRKLHRLPAHAAAAHRRSLGEEGDTGGALVCAGSGDGQRPVGDLGDMCEQLVDCVHAVADIR